MLGFETLTFAPIERALIEPDAADGGGTRLVDAYHARVVEVLGPQLDAEEQAWLKAKCAPIGG